LIADITFNRAGGGASQLWALSIANQVTGSLPACLPASGCAAPNGNICFEPEIMEIIWLPLHLNKSDPATMERERAQVVMGPLNIHRRLLPCKSIIIWACDQRASSFTLQAPLHCLLRRRSFATTRVVTSQIRTQLFCSLVQRRAGARTHTHTRSRSNTKLVVRVFSRDGSGRSPGN
jgi:hypothetical protein